jgi:hypothetical protein
MPGLVADLRTSEAQRYEAGCRVHLVSDPVLRLLGGRAVIREAIRLYHQT